jgi:hypothetical protein
MVIGIRIGSVNFVNTHATAKFVLFLFKLETSMYESNFEDFNNSTFEFLNLYKMVYLHPF